MEQQWDVPGTGVPVPAADGSPATRPGQPVSAHGEPAADLETLLEDLSGSVSTRRIRDLARRRREAEEKLARHLLAQERATGERTG